MHFESMLTLLKTHTDTFTHSVTEPFTHSATHREPYTHSRQIESHTLRHRTNSLTDKQKTQSGTHSSTRKLHN